MLTYALKLAQRYDGLIVATFPDIPAAVAYGRDHDEAIDEALPALEAALSRYVSAGHDLPVPRARGSLAITTERYEPAAAI